MPGIGGLPEFVHIFDSWMFGAEIAFLLRFLATQQQPEEAVGRNATSLTGLSTRGAAGPHFFLEGVGGVMIRRADVTSFTNTGGAVFPTSGDRDFDGAYVGLNGVLSSAGSPFRWNVFGHVGYGEAEVTGFGGAFRASEDGVFYEVGTGVQYRINERMAFGPQISYFHFDNGGIEMKDWVAELTLSVDLN